MYLGLVWSQLLCTPFNQATKVPCCSGVSILSIGVCHTAPCIPGTSSPGKVIGLPRLWLALEFKSVTFLNFYVKYRDKWNQTTIASLKLKQEMLFVLQTYWNKYIVWMLFLWCFLYLDVWMSSFLVFFFLVQCTDSKIIFIYDIDKCV